MPNSCTFLSLTLQCAMVTALHLKTNNELFRNSIISRGLMEGWDYANFKIIKGGARCEEKTGVTLGIGFSTQGTYGDRYRAAGGQSVFYERELVNCIGSVKNNTNLPIAIVFERDSDVEKIDNAIVNSADCVLVNTETHVDNTWGAKLMGQLSSPWERTIFVDADVTFCADPSYVFDTFEFDVALTVENDAGLDDRWLREPQQLYAVQNGRVLKEINAGIMTYRKNNYSWEFLREQFHAMQDTGRSYTDQPFIKKQLERRGLLKVQYLPAEFNLRQNNWQKHAVLLRSPVYMIHSRLLAMPEHSGGDFKDARMIPLQDLKAKHGGQICSLLNSIKGPRLFSARQALLVDTQ